MFEKVNKKSNIFLAILHLFVLLTIENMFAIIESNQTNVRFYSAVRWREKKWKILCLGFLRKEQWWYPLLFLSCLLVLWLLSETGIVSPNRPANRSVTVVIAINRSMRQNSLFDRPKYSFLVIIEMASMISIIRAQISKLSIPIIFPPRSHTIIIIIHHSVCFCHIFSVCNAFWGTKDICSGLSLQQFGTDW